METTEHAPNHHAHYGDFSGFSGAVAALSMVLGRGRHTKLAMQLAKPLRGDVVLDVGCGPGSAARHAARRGIKVVGIDPAPVMLRVARLLTWSRSAEFRDGTAEDLPVADQSADVVWAIATVHHWNDVDRGVAEARRVLVPGGRFVAIERGRTADAQGLASHGWTVDQAEALAAMCRAHGFAKVSVERGPGERHPSLAVVAIGP